MRIEIENALQHGLFALTLALIAVLLTRAAMRLDIIAHPNHRSAHDRPTPKSGGLAVAASFFLGLGTIWLIADVARIEEGRFLAYLGLTGFLLVAALIDDLIELSALAKLAAQILTAILFTLLVARFEVIELFGLGNIALGPLGALITIVWIIAMMNVVNFMDGLNGMVAGCVALASLMIGAFAFLAGAHFVYLAALALAAALIGFLPFNLFGGRIFLGETGSSLLGFVMASFGVIANRADLGQMSIWVVPVIFLPFISDIGCGLISRIRRGHHPFHGHREFPFHLLNRLGWSHGRVSGFYALLFAFSGMLAVLVQAAPDGWRLIATALAALPFMAGMITILAIAARKGLLPPAESRKASGQI